MANSVNIDHKTSTVSASANESGVPGILHLGGKYGATMFDSGYDANGNPLPGAVPALGNEGAIRLNTQNGPGNAYLEMSNGQAYYKLAVPVDEGDLIAYAIIFG